MAMAPPSVRQESAPPAPPTSSSDATRPPVRRTPARPPDRSGWLLRIGGVLLGIAAAFLIATFLARLYLGSSSTGIFLSKQLHGEVDVLVQYPARLYFDSSPALGARLVLTVPDTSQARSPRLTLTLIHNDGMSITNVAGQSIPNTIELPMREGPQATAAVFVKPLPRGGGLSEPIVLQIDFSGHPGNQDELILEVEPEWNPAVRAFVADIGPLLTAIFALAGGVLSLAGLFQQRAKNEREEQEKVRRERDSARSNLIEETRKQLDSPRAIEQEFAVLELSRLADRANAQPWGRSENADAEPWSENQVTMIRGMCNRVENDRKFQALLVRRAGEEYYLKNHGTSAEILFAAQQFFSKPSRERERPLAERLSGVARVLFAPNDTLDGTSIRAGLEAARQVYADFYQDARALAIATTLEAYAQPNRPADLGNCFRKDERFRWLLRDDAVREAGIEPELGALQYEWVRNAGRKVEIYAPPDAWCEEFELQRRPFGRPGLVFDPVLLEGMDVPEFWERMIAEQPLVLYGAEPRDAIAAAYLLRREIMSPSRVNQQDRVLISSIFPLWLELPLEEYDAAHQEKSILDATARAAAAAWRQLLALNVEALFELDPTEQSILASLLYWESGGDANLVSGLRNMGLDNPKWEEALMERLRERGSGSILVGEQGREQYRAWLRVRPRGLERMYLIVVSDEPQKVAQARANEEALVAAAENFARQNITLKLFTLNPDGLELGSQVIRWDSRALLNTLAAWVSQASGPRKTYKRAWDLFAYEDTSLVPEQEPENLDELKNFADGIIAEVAHHSVSVLRDIGNELIQTRIALGWSPARPYLDREVLDIVRNNRNRA